MHIIVQKPPLSNQKQENFHQTKNLKNIVPTENFSRSTPTLISRL